MVVFASVDDPTLDSGSKGFLDDRSLKVLNKDLLIFKRPQSPQTQEVVWPAKL